MRTPSPLYVAVILIPLLGGCTSVRKADLDPEKQFGHRAEDSTDGRITTVIAPPKGDQAYRYNDAFVDEVSVRPARGIPMPVPVEILVKGAFPDSCTELHEAVQKRSGNLIEVSLRTRRPQSALCASVVRPFRFYLTLEGVFEAGPYTLKLNGDAYPFEVHEPNKQRR